MKLKLVLALAVVASGCIGSTTYTSEQASNALPELEDLRSSSFHSQLEDGNQYSLTTNNQEERKTVEKENHTMFTRQFMIMPESSNIPVVESSAPIIIIGSVYHFNDTSSAKQNYDKAVFQKKDVIADEIWQIENRSFGRVAKINVSSGSKLTEVTSREQNVYLQASTANIEEFKVDEAREILKRMREKLKS
ncbi:MAG: hypothetical protein H8Z69_04340 [Nanohaloarchaea archaeon]|nr:hypothetical protein [Candidatus Nanohaloarchaea archaeon]